MPRTTTMNPPDPATRATAWLDLAQGLTGLVLVLFMWAHMVLVSSILLGEGAMYTVTKALEGQFVFTDDDRACRQGPGIVEVVIACQGTLVPPPVDGFMIAL